MNLIPDWKKAHKFLTVQLTAALGMLALAYDYLPALREYMPEGWMKYAFGVILVARLIKQNSLHKDE